MPGPGLSLRLPPSPVVRHDHKGNTSICSAAAHADFSSPICSEAKVCLGLGCRHRGRSTAQSLLRRILVHTAYRFTNASRKCCPAFWVSAVASAAAIARLPPPLCWSA